MQTDILIINTVIAICCEILPVFVCLKTLQVKKNESKQNSSKQNANMLLWIIKGTD